MNITGCINTHIIVGIYILKIMINLKNIFYEDIEIQDIMNEYYQIKKNLIISTFNTDFLEDYNRCGAVIFSVHLYFNKLSDDISHFVVA